MTYKNNINHKEYKPFVTSSGSSFTNQIDTIAPLLAEIYKIVQRMDKRKEEFFKKLSGVQNDY
jgi:hypothetical protein